MLNPKKFKKMKNLENSAKLAQKVESTKNLVKKAVEKNDFQKMCENTRKESKSWKQVKKTFLSFENKENEDFRKICEYFFSSGKNEKMFREKLIEKANKRGEASEHAGKLVINNFIKNLIKSGEFEKLPICENIKSIKKQLFAKRAKEQQERENKK